MNEFIEKLIGRMEEEKYTREEKFLYDTRMQENMSSYNKGLNMAIRTVNQLAEEYKTGLKDYHEGQEIEPYGRPRVYMSIEDLNELKAYRDLGTLHQIRVLIDRYHELNDSYHQLIKEEHKGGWIPCSGCSDCQNKECEHYGKV